MDAVGVAILAGLLCIVGLSIAWWRWQQLRMIKAQKEWPRTDATIQSARLETVASGRGSKIILPVFGFSYKVNDDYYSGYFSLMPYTVEYEDSILARMTNRVLPVCYNPEHPEKWLLPEQMIEGYKVEQKMGPHMLRFYPRN